MSITASKLYDYMQCPHRIWRDAYGPQDEKINETNPFVKLLWDKGVLYEKKVISGMTELLDISEGSVEQRFRETIKAMKEGNPLIYQGVLISDDLVGIPDLLRKNEDGTYMPIDIKSGMGLEGASEEDPDSGAFKKHYAVQLALYVDILRRLGFENRKEGLIFDIDGNEVIYNLEEAIGVRNKISFWELYEKVREEAKILLNNEVQNSPALGSICKLCPWYNSCSKWAKDKDDLTTLYDLGRSKRDVLEEDLGIQKVQDILSLDLNEILEKKKKDKEFLKGLGEKRLEKIIQRAKIIKEIKKPIVYNPIKFPIVKYELFFDIEDDPTQAFVYLHGVYERGPEGERFIDFTSREISEEAEKKAWADFWEYIGKLPKDDFAVYYYSHHEKTTYKRMQKKYPDVISENKLENFFENPNVIDLFSVVRKNTDWPLGSYSIKAIANYLGFNWRDKTPSGALSIEWFNKYIETKDEAMLNRILLYNEDDCKATMVLKDNLEKL